MLKKKVLLIGMVTVVCLLAGCGKDAEAVEPETVTKETVAKEESSVESSEAETEDEMVEEITEEVAEEGVEEDPTANLSNEEWVMSLILEIDKPIFVIFNNVTGEKKVLEDGAEYTLLDGDEIGTIAPPRWFNRSEEVYCERK